MKTTVLMLVLGVTVFVGWLLLPPPIDEQISQLQDQLHQIDQQLEKSNASADMRESLRKERQLLHARMGSLCWELVDGECDSDF